MVAQYGADTYLPDHSPSFTADLSQSKHPHWMVGGGDPHFPLQAVLIGCSLRANHTEVNITKDGLLITGPYDAIGRGELLVYPEWAHNNFTWGSTLPTSTIERQFSIAFRSSQFNAGLTEYTHAIQSTISAKIYPEMQLWDALTGGGNPSWKLDHVEDLLANLTTSWLYSYRVECRKLKSGCGPTANTIGRSNITVYYNGDVGDVQVSPWRAITGFIASLSLFFLSLLILGVKPVNHESRAALAVAEGAPTPRKHIEPLGAGFLDVLRLGGPAVLGEALNASDRRWDPDGDSSVNLDDIRVRRVHSLLSTTFRLLFLRSRSLPPLLPCLTKDWSRVKRMICLYSTKASNQCHPQYIRFARYSSNPLIFCGLRRLTLARLISLAQYGRSGWHIYA